MNFAEALIYVVLYFGVIYISGYIFGTVSL